MRNVNSVIYIYVVLLVYCTFYEIGKKIYYIHKSTSVLNILSSSDRVMVSMGLGTHILNGSGFWCHLPISIVACRGGTTFP